MYNRLLGATNAVVGLADQFFSRLRQDLNFDIIGDFTLLYQEADEIEIRLGRRGEADLNFLEAKLDQMAKHTQLALMPHRLDQRLVSVAQVHAAPDRGLVDDLRRPLSVRQIDRFECLVFFSGDKCHVEFL